ncbi:hypothetical protein LK12_22245 [Novosphingobium malaysiense]|uniref:HTH luxR-type domain-containing protein n=2 Tax=Novosphingobium malaysiense TaxID=1348853 RepID=A0A0B1ZIJ2_9SPHN|nr:hypothetical protein LK12_22245 [Novosphingobium malaysiense]
MYIASVAAEFARSLSAVRSPGDLKDALVQACGEMGLGYFALSHHVDFARSPDAMRIHNYPETWEDWYLANRLGLCDPIHRASHVVARGFYWHEVPRLIPLNRHDYHVLEKGRHAGLGDGVTVPAHVPGEARGSCTFVVPRGAELPEDVLPWAQIVGMGAFEGARNLRRSTDRHDRPRVSERQRQCIALAGRGLSDRSIAQRLGIGVQTVMEYMRDARARLGASNRTQLVVCLLAAGELCIDDLAPLAF